MWKISNEINKPTLIRYQRIIISFFELVIEQSKSPNKLADLETDNFLKHLFHETAFLDEKLLDINISTDDKFEPLVKEIIKLNPALLSRQYEIFKWQNSEISKGNYNFDPEIHPDSLKKIFKDYFYDKFFGIDWIWKELIGKKFNRGIFKTNFKLENELYVCPYCDSDTISNERNGWIEHFLPKSKFPYLSCNPFNLIPSCTACNVAGSGKGENVKNPIHCQYNIQSGDYLEFAYANGEIIIVENEDASVENFIELLKLRNRYKEQAVKISAINRLKINYDIFLGIKRRGEFDRDSFFDYIYRIGRNSGFFFVQRDLLNHIGEI